MIILTLTCLLLAFVAFGIMDELAHHFDDIKLKFIKSNSKFWDKRVSWMNKWKQVCSQPVGDTIGSPTGYILTTEERFWGSSRWFVFVTDGWHLMQFIGYHLVCTSISLLAILDFWWAMAASTVLHVVVATVKHYTMKVI